MSRTAPFRTPVGDLEAHLRADLASAEPPAFEELAAFVDGTLDPAAEEALASWVAVDPELGAEVADLAALRAELAAAGRLREVELPIAERRGTAFPRRYLAAAATLALALGGSWLATRAGRPTRPPAPAPAELAADAGPAGLPAPPVVPSLPSAAPAELAGGAGSFESGTLQGWQLPSSRLDFESGQIDAPSAGSGA